MKLSALTLALAFFFSTVLFGQTEKIDTTIDLFSAKGIESAVAGKVSFLPKGASIPLRLEQIVRSEDLRVGETIHFATQEAINVEGRTVIAFGAEATAIVSEIRKKGRWGRSGKVVLTDFKVKAVDRSIIPLTGEITFEEAPAQKKFAFAMAGAGFASGLVLAAASGGLAAPIALPLTVSGFFIKGKAVEAPKGLDFNMARTRCRTRING